MDARPAAGHAALTACLWTDRLRGAVHVHANDFHHPVVLARELGTAALFSGGRFDAGIGAGWMAEDYRRLGVPFDAPGLRIARLAEAVSLLKRLWREESVDFDGRFYQVHGMTGSPLLSGEAPPRLVMGGGGDRMLTLAAREADVVLVNVRLESGTLGPERGATATLEAAHHKIDVIRDAAGPRFDTLVLQVELHYVEVTTDRTAGLDRAAAVVGMSPAGADASPHVLVGTHEEMVERLRQRRAELGFSYVCLSADHADTFAPVVAALAGY
jgi:probable F420-dependent oxidoreductase